jgi:hypothetical protein
MGHFKNKLLSDSDFVFKRMNSPKHHHRFKALSGEYSSLHWAEIARSLL